MFDLQNVADFIRTCMQQAPNVEYYALVFGDLHGLVPYALSSSHSVTAGNQALFVEAMAKVPTQGVATAISKFCGDLLEYQRKKYLYLKDRKSVV